MNKKLYTSKEFEVGGVYRYIGNEFASFLVLSRPVDAQDDYYSVWILRLDLRNLPYKTHLNSKFREFHKL